jgi:hypothetical protein
MFWFELAELLLGGCFEFGFEWLVEAGRTGEPKANGIGLV